MILITSAAFPPYITSPTPISFLPTTLLAIVKILPFRYMFSFPLEIYFNKLAPSDLLWGFAMQGLWVVILTALYQVLWTKGRRAYASFGN